MGKSRKKTDMTGFTIKAILLLVLAAVGFVPGSARASEEADVRAVVQQEQVRRVGAAKPVAAAGRAPYRRRP